MIFVYVFYFRYELNLFFIVEYGGIYVDFLVYFYKGGWRIQQILMEKFVGRGVIINVKQKVFINLDYYVFVVDFIDYEDIYGWIFFGVVVIMNLGWSDKYFDLNVVFNIINLFDLNIFYFLVWYEDVVLWLINKRNINIIGVDMFFIDYG